MIELGTIDIDDLKLGDAQVSAVYAGTELVWEGVNKELLWSGKCFEFLDSNNNHVDEITIGNNYYNGYNPQDPYNESDFLITFRTTETDEYAENYVTGNQEKVYKYTIKKCVLKSTMQRNWDLPTLDSLYRDSKFSQRIISVEHFEIIKRVPLSNFNSFFSQFLNLRSFNIADFAGNHISDWRIAFEYTPLPSTEPLDLAGLVTPYCFSVENMLRNLHDASNKILVTTNWDFTGLVNHNMNFRYGHVKEIRGYQTWNTAGVTTLGGINDTDATSYDITPWNKQSATSIAQLFYNCKNLTAITGITSTLFNQCTNVNRMCSNCEALLSLDFANFTFVNKTDTAYMLENCKSLDIANHPTTIDLTNCTIAKRMYANVSSQSLAIAITSLVITARMTNTEDMFAGTKFTFPNGISGVFSSITTMAGMFYDCEFGSYTFDCSGQTMVCALMANMFSRRYTSALNKPNVDMHGCTWPAAGVDCSGMFRYGYFGNIDLRGMVVRNPNLMFSECAWDVLDTRGMDTSLYTGTAVFSLNGRGNTSASRIYFDDAIFNCNTCSFDLSVILYDRVADIELLFDTLINHSKVSDPDWLGQTVNLYNNVEHLTADTINNTPSLLAKKQTAESLGWSFGF